MLRPFLKSVTISGLCLCWLSLGGTAAGDEKLSYSRDIRPILADKCFHCHGADAGARQADLRLDRGAAELAERGVIVPGAAERSALYQRITAADPDERMPPPDQKRRLSDGEVQLLRRWIEEGGRYEGHWAFLPPGDVSLPAAGGSPWPRNPIDCFVLERLNRRGLRPAAEADPLTLLRRVTLDLTGLPPTPDEVAAFLADASPNAYERAVDRLLDSPRYGERMALVWLDAARFADSGGYQGDILRSMWLWRDWVIHAYNQNMPFDRFSIEQLAGDLLDNPTLEQRIATGFNRNHRINDEDGIILEEFRVEYVVDRVETTATVWLGLTMGCARCHDHKYDPISQEDFYGFFAFFNSIDERGRGHGNAPPLVQVPGPQLARQIAAADAELRSLKEELSGLAATASAAREAVEQKLEAAGKRRDQLLAKAPTAMVMQELPQPRETFLLLRGGYDRPGPRVQPAAPQIGPTSDDRLQNRLDLARWLFDPRHPLTARVAVNRYWQLYFGRGLVETQEDFGTQGALPSHPELQDWLAREFIRSGWDVKRMQRLIVTSATYRQSSSAARDQWERDPENRWLARGPRYRLTAETIRDQALAASGLLVERLGGPSVRPDQPPGLWQELASASPEYEPGQGADLYRRSLYTFVRRTVPPPAMTTFDAPNRETCIVRRPRTNTPLQALALMNDPIYVETSRCLAERALGEVAGDAESRLVFIFRSLLARAPTPDERATLRGAYQFYVDRFSDRPQDAARLVAAGRSAPDVELDAVELAACTAVAMLVLNLDETITKE